MDTNIVIEREKPIIDQICDIYQYDNNIRHLLYAIIPAFIIKYGVSREKLIINTFKNTHIILSNEQDKYVKAYYSSKIVKNNGEYDVVHFMVLQNYQGTFMVDLIDNIVHEFNHAINSYNNGIRVGKKHIYLRTGLAYRIYDKESLEFIKKSQSTMLEEIINTKQTEEIINIMKSFDENNSLISNTIYALNRETEHKYNSNSYYLESSICKEILENRTFIHTLATLRLNGEVFDINHWFDDITGEDGSYKRLINLLTEVYDLELEYVSRKIMKGLTLNKIRDHSKKIMDIVKRFDNNVNYR